MKGKALFFIALYIFWIILSERFTAETFIIGIGVIIIVAMLNKHEDEQESIAKKPLLYLKLLLVLLKEIVVSNIEVAMIVLSPKMDINPHVFQYRTKLKSEKLRVILANTITITPGTVTASLDGDVLTIHALKDSNEEGVQNSTIEKILLEIEGRE